MQIPQSLTRQSIAAHSWLGLMAGALMYVICLSGTIAVFAPELERWEQPYAEEFLSYDASTLENTFNDTLESGMDITPHMYLVLPTDEVPRARIASENESWFLDSDGSLGAKERNAWTEMLLDLHLYLHLPKSWGMILVSALGAMLAALILSGLFAHRRLIRDAFKLRTGAARGTQQLDIHNRLSVWGVPFHLMIAVTGAYFGLALPFLGASSKAFYEGDNERVLELLFGAEPALQKEIGRIHIASALQQVREMAPESTPIFVTLHDAGTPAQHVGVSATHPKRLIYSENYLFDAQGTFIGKAGFSDAEAGRQVLYSIYRLHFGYFGNLLVKIGYGILGLALTIVSVTGINVWLARRRKVDALNDVWAGIVWGLPVALVLSATAQVGFDVPAASVVWAVVLAACLYAGNIRDERRSRSTLLNALVLSLLCLVLAHVARFGDDALHGLPLMINSGLVLSAMAISGWHGRLAVARH